eukprot:12888179-Prorocentrum_lima.AAC.1
MTQADKTWHCPETPPEGDAQCNCDTLSGWTSCQCRRTCNTNCSGPTQRPRPMEHQRVPYQ